MRTLSACLGSIVLALATQAHEAHCQLADTAQLHAPAFTLKPLIVSAPIAFTTLGGASALSVRADSMHIGAAPTLEAVTRELPFLQVRTNARGESYFTVRGSGFDAREVAVLIDDVPVSLGFDHRADLAAIPASGATTLTVIRGVPALLYGPNVLGGVVAASINDAHGDSRHRVSAGFDDAGTYGLHGFAATAPRLGAGTLRVRAGAGYRESPDVPLARDVAEPAAYNSAGLRTNSDRLQRDAFVAARWSGARGAWLGVSGVAARGLRGAPPELGVTTPRFWRYPEVQRTLGVLSLGSGLRASPLGGRASAQASVAFDRGHVELNSYSNASYSTVQDRESDDDRNTTMRALARHTLGKASDISAAFTYADVQRDETVTPGVQSTYRQRLWSGAIESGWQISRVRVSGGLALDAADTPESSDKPAVGKMDAWGGRLGVVAPVSNSIGLHASIGRRARFPSLRELYGGALRMFEPNPELRNELLVASEGGVTARFGSVQLQSVLFHHHITDQIVRTTTPAPARKVKRVNRDETTSTGMELLAAWRLAGLGIMAHLTGQTVASRDPNADAEFRAEYQPKWYGGVRADAALPLELHGRVDARVTGAQYCLATNGTYNRLNRTTRWDAQLLRRWRAYEFTIAGSNLTDRAIYDQCGLPQAGRIIRFQIDVR